MPQSARLSGGGGLIYIWAMPKERDIKDNGGYFQVTGNMVRVFFSEERREEVLAAIGSLKAWQLSRGRDMTVEVKEQLRCLLQRLNVINRVMSCDSVVKVMAFRSYCLETYTMILTNFSTASVSETLHRLLAHTWEFMVLNENCGLLRSGEGGSESMHHVERTNRQYGSRKVSLMKGNEDTFRFVNNIHLDNTVLYNTSWCSVGGF